MCGNMTIKILHRIFCLLIVLPLWFVAFVNASNVTLHPKLFAKFPVRFSDGKSFEIWHFPPSRIITPEEFEELQIKSSGATFQSCFDFNLDRKLSDFDVMSKYVHGTYFDGFLMMEPQTKKTLGTLSLSLKAIDGKNSAVFIFNMCLAPELQGAGYGGPFIDESLNSLYKRLKVTPSPERPFLLGLSLMNHNPTYMAACKAYVKGGFYLYDYGNVTYKSKFYLQDKIKQLQAMSANPHSTLMTVCNRDWDSPPNGMGVGIPVRFNPTGSEDDKIVSLFRLDTNGKGLVPFSIPPNDFCAKVKESMEQKVKEQFANPRWDSYSEDDEREI